MKMPGGAFCSLLVSNPKWNELAAAIAGTDFSMICSGGKFSGPPHAASDTTNPSAATHTPTLPFHHPNFISPPVLLSLVCTLNHIT